MTPEQAYNNIASVLEQCLKLGVYKSFNDVNIIQQSLTTIKNSLFTGNSQNGLIQKSPEKEKNTEVTT